MKRILLFIALLPVAWSFLGCAADPKDSIAPVYGPLLFQENPPVTSTFPLFPLSSHKKERRYLAYDVNDDGEQEYFLLDNAGANKAVFILVNSRGDPLIHVSDENRGIWCDWLLIMESKHNGYCDIISSGSDAFVQECIIWQHDGTRYVSSRTSFKVDMDILPGVPRNPEIRAYWNWILEGRADRLKKESNS